MILTYNIMIKIRSQSFTKEIIREEQPRRTFMDMIEEIKEKEKKLMRDRRKSVNSVNSLHVFTRPHSPCKIPNLTKEPSICLLECRKI